MGASGHRSSAAWAVAARAHRGQSERGLMIGLRKTVA
jgi:hypothetical protein